MGLRKNPTLKSSTIRVGLTIGDPAGIGPAITLKALKMLKGKAHFTVIGDSFVLAKAAKALKIKPRNFSFSKILRGSFLDRGIKSLPTELVDLNNVKRKYFVFGRISAGNGKASLEYLDAAVELLKKKKIDCLVTCPISKEAIKLAGSKFSGHTEYLADKFNRKDLIMMLANDRFKFSLVTRHIPLKNVCRKITRNALESNILNTIKGLKRLFLIRNPRVVVCGVNPHASDNGVIGVEELQVIKPAIAALRKKCRGATIAGPLSSDVAISRAAKGDFDCVIALYHDQALIPLKLTDFDSGINFTLGLPFVRTSPLHGTAFELANKPTLANPNSLIAAVKLAIKCTLSRKRN
ncbi:MAG: 4-hydroxythreonine-4-phosphate dehydrogenase PdxA [Candidatus Omnitrophica bacterium]|nr:4-hydroxythreonine-4-phosphate dehydrogenase PdxA [Candidatus Omnitrophota bacterium]MBU1923777.1 4-hydroxythreonine-4-phosphate dehydrogenase PdxA [Candidatus Omnitrophota bacterium]